MWPRFFKRASGYVRTKRDLCALARGRSAQGREWCRHRGLAPATGVGGRVHPCTPMRE
eukprot:NODE_29373_length_448_cov_1.651090.p3 GENE.NODE_29373_length_448_cov_1.651090~~NODE_29373_length_448_cov_1.651090.p3  ORF type:complete len:58 (-),score=3.79 NODE_29373_length_448_cov_1.651090:215-388(-)